MIRRTFATSQNGADIPSISCSKTKSTTAAPQQPYRRWAILHRSFFTISICCPCVTKVLSQTNKSNDVQKGNDTETLNSIRTARIERRRNTGQSWKSARMVRYQLNRNQTKGGIDYSFHWWMWAVYSHPKIAYLFLRIPRRFIVRFNHKCSLSQDRNA